MNEIEDALLELAHDLEVLEFRLMGLRARVPSLTGNAEPLPELEELQAPGALREHIDSILYDSLSPAVRELRSIAGYQKRTSRCRNSR